VIPETNKEEPKGGIFSSIGATKPAEGLFSMKSLSYILLF